MMTLKMYLIHSSSRTRINVVQTLPSTHLILKHIKQPNANAPVLFVDFSSAFNTTQPHVLLEKMKAMEVIPFIHKWYLSFLTGRSQLARVNRTHSLSLTTNTGVPQGCVSSPLFYTLHKQLYIHNLWKLHCQFCTRLCNPQPIVCPQRH